jgi:hypothetical protein
MAYQQYSNKKREQGRHWKCPSIGLNGREEASVPKGKLQERFALLE